jgi:hypothetical protein
MPEWKQIQREIVCLPVVNMLRSTGHVIEIAKINGIDPQAYLADILAEPDNAWPIQQLDEFLPWA